MPISCASRLLRHAPSRLLSNPGMKVISTIRRERLQQLLTERGLTLSDFNDKMGRSRRDATLSQILNANKNSHSGKPRSLGDEQARAIEAKFELPTGWLDRDPDMDRLSGQLLEAREATTTYNAWPFPRIARAAIAALSPGQLQQIEDLLLSALQLAAPSHLAATGTGPAQ